MSHPFIQIGYTGWVILFDEAELMGRLSKKARMNAYKNMAFFLMPPKMLESVFTLFALSASYEEDEIEGKHEYETLAQLEEQEPMKSVLETLVKAQQLLPLTRSKIREVFGRIRDFHARTYVCSDEKRDLLGQIPYYVNIRLCRLGTRIAMVYYGKYAKI